MVRRLTTRLMLVTDRRAAGGRPLEQIVVRSVAGGVDAVQVREKDLPAEELAELVERLNRLVGGEALVLVNGAPEVALATGTGLHLPAADRLPLDWPPNRPWGRSVHSLAAARAAAREGAHYLLLGAIFPTTSKPGLAPVGLRLVREVGTALPGVPLLAIGGITAENAAAAVRAGATGVAVRSAIMTAADPELATRPIRLAVERASLGSPAVLDSSQTLRSGDQDGLLLTGDEILDL